MSRAGDTTQDALVRNAINLAVRAERERCAKLAEALALELEKHPSLLGHREVSARTARTIAKGIRIGKD